MKHAIPNELRVAETKWLDAAKFKYSIVGSLDLIIMDDNPTESS